MRQRTQWGWEFVRLVPAVTLAVALSSGPAGSATPDPRVVVIELDRASLAVNALDRVEAEVRDAVTTTATPRQADVSHSDTSVYVRVRLSKQGEALARAIRERVARAGGFVVTETPAAIYRIDFSQPGDADAPTRQRDLSRLSSAMSFARSPLPGVQIEDDIGQAIVRVDDPATRPGVEDALRQIPSYLMKVSKLDERSWRVTLDDTATQTNQSKAGDLAKMFGMSLPAGQAVLSRVMLAENVRAMLRDPPYMHVETKPDGVEAWLPDPERHADYGERLRRATAGRSDLTVSSEPGLLMKIDLNRPLSATESAAMPGYRTVRQVSFLFDDLERLADPPVEVVRADNSVLVDASDPTRRLSLRKALAARDDLKVRDAAKQMLEVSPVARATPPIALDPAALARTVVARARGVGVMAVTTSPIAPDRIEARFQTAAEADGFRTSIRSASTAVALRLVDDNAANLETPPSAGDQRLRERDPARPSVWVRPEAPIRGDMIADARVTMSQWTGDPVIAFRFTEEGRSAFAAMTASNVGRSFAIVLDGVVIAAPKIMSPILGGEGVIEGGFTEDDARAIAMALKAHNSDLPLKLADEPAR